MVALREEFWIYFWVGLEFGLVLGRGRWGSRFVFFGVGIYFTFCGYRDIKFGVFVEYSGVCV